MNELTKLSATIPTALLVGLLTIAPEARSDETPEIDPPSTMPSESAAQEATPAPPAVHFGWTTWKAAPSGTVLKQGEWRIWAERAEVDAREIALSGDVRVAGPGVYLRAEAAVVTGDSVKAGNSAVLTKDVRMEAKEAFVAIKTGTVRLVGVQPQQN